MNEQEERRRWAVEQAREFLCVHPSLTLDQDEVRILIDVADVINAYARDGRDPVHYFANSEEIAQIAKQVAHADVTTDVQRELHAERRKKIMQLLEERAYLRHYTMEQLRHAKQ